MKTRRTGTSQLISYFARNGAFVGMLIIVVLLVSQGVHSTSDSLALVAVMLGFIAILPTLPFKQPYDEDIHEIKAVLHEIADHLASQQKKDAQKESSND